MQSAALKAETGRAAATASPPPASCYLAAQGVTRRYPGVVALDGVELKVRPGSVQAATGQAVMGENGAGKSTLMRILAGNILPEEGGIRLKGRPVRLHGPRDATHAGIAMIHQGLLLVPGMAIAGSIWLGHEPRSRLGLVDHGELRRRTRAPLDQVGIDLEPERQLGSLTVASQCRRRGGRKA